MGLQLLGLCRLESWSEKARFPTEEGWQSPRSFHRSTCTSDVQMRSVFLSLLLLDLGQTCGGSGTLELRCHSSGVWAGHACFAAMPLAD